MDEQKRPGGLTALAVFNFIFSFFSLLVCIGAILTPALLNRIQPGQMTGQMTEQMAEQVREQKEFFENLSTIEYLLLIAPPFISAVLLLLSGIGYIQMKSFLGRDIGNLYAALAILNVFASPFIMRPESNIRLIASIAFGLFYPVLTLILINTTYKKILTEGQSESESETEDS